MVRTPQVPKSGAGSRITVDAFTAKAQKNSSSTINRSPAKKESATSEKKKASESSASAQASKGRSPSKIDKISALKKKIMGKGNGGSSSHRMTPAQKKVSDEDSVKIPLVRHTLLPERKIVGGRTFTAVKETVLRHSKKQEARLENQLTEENMRENLNRSVKVPRTMNKMEYRRYKEIIRYQSSNAPLIPRTRFNRLVRGIAAELMGFTKAEVSASKAILTELKTPVRFTRAAIDIMREITEKMMTKLMRQSARATVHRDRITTDSKDMRLALTLDEAWSDVRSLMIRDVQTQIEKATLIPPKDKSERRKLELETEKYMDLL